ncbi:MAG TPA: hypothetical protein PLG79_09515 [Spirochaetales bacterium]|nr:hypothetical protein [Spirochaetales bacterium]
MGTSAEKRSLIWGTPIVALLHKKKCPSVSIQLFSREELDTRTALLLFFKLENRRDRWSWEELVRLSGFLEAEGIFLEEEEIRKYIFSDGGWQRVEKFRALPPLLRSLVEEKKLDAKTAEKIQEIPEEALQILLPALESLSYSEHRIYVRMFLELVKRENLNKADCIALAERIGTSQDPTGEIRKMRYPELTGLENRFKQIVEPAIKGTGIRIAPPPHFEGSRFTLEFQFESPEQLNRKVFTLQQFIEKGNDLFSLLR